MSCVSCRSRRSRWSWGRPAPGWSPGCPGCPGWPGKPGCPAMAATVTTPAGWRGTTTQSSEMELMDRCPGPATAPALILPAAPMVAGAPGGQPAGPGAGWPSALVLAAAPTPPPPDRGRWNTRWNTPQPCPLGCGWPVCWPVGCPACSYDCWAPIDARRGPPEVPKLASMLVRVRVL